MPPKKKSSGPKKKDVGVDGIVYIKATFNNTIVTITDMEGNTVVWGSAGKAGFKGSKSPRRSPRPWPRSRQLGKLSASA